MPSDYFMPSHQFCVVWQSVPTAVDPLQLLIAHELDGAVGHSKETWCKSLVQTSHTFVPSKLQQTICEEERHQTEPACDNWQWMFIDLPSTPLYCREAGAASVVHRHRRVLTTQMGLVKHNVATPVQ